MSERLKTCPQCGDEYDLYHGVCGNCGYPTYGGRVMNFKINAAMCEGVKLKAPENPDRTEDD